MATWQVKIQDPSGHTRYVPFNGTTLSLGTREEAGIRLRDTSLGDAIAHLHEKDGKFWIDLHGKRGFIGSLEIDSAELPLQAPFLWGETRISIESLLSETNIAPKTPSHLQAWITCSSVGIRLLHRTRKAATTDLPIYLHGETGSGKEVLAKIIHAWSERKDGPFIPLHCAALPLSLAESELFGHTRGAFTGAESQRRGALLSAHGGTLFLDEIGDLGLDMQVKLLRFLDSGEIRPVGSDKTIKADIRLICATHKPLKELIKSGAMRHDLYYRIASITLSIPPLRDRPQDIELLTHFFAERFKKIPTHSTMLKLKSYGWPGNVRELKQVIECAATFSYSSDTFLSTDSFEFLDDCSEEAMLHGVTKLHDMERIMVIRALKLSSGNRTEAAQILGIARSTLFEMLKRHKI